MVLYIKKIATIFFNYAIMKIVALEKYRRIINNPISSINEAENAHNNCISLGVNEVKIHDAFWPGLDKLCQKMPKVWPLSLDELSLKKK